MLDDLSAVKYPRCHLLVVMFVTRSAHRTRGRLRARTKRAL